MAHVQQEMEDAGCRVDQAPPRDDEVRETHNFAPGNVGVVYRADTDGEKEQEVSETGQECSSLDNDDDDDYGKGDNVSSDQSTGSQRRLRHRKGDRPRYKLQAMKWGLIPSWTKQAPSSYGALLKTINCRDDSLAPDRGGRGRGSMWTPMKKQKRCVVVCQGFYEWLKKGPSGRERIPHYVKRKDGRLMCLAGLWDHVRYKDADSDLYTYTIITTASNDALRFLHDRMPVILEPGTEAMAMWLDQQRTEWTTELQSVLRPYGGDLECYEVPREVGKVGNDSPGFILPVDREKREQQGIARFFGDAQKRGKEGGKRQLGDEAKKIDTTRAQAQHLGQEHAPTTGLDGSSPLPRKKRSIDSTASDMSSPTPTPAPKTRRRSMDNEQGGGRNIMSFFKKG